MNNNLTLNQLNKIFENNRWNKDLPIAIEIFTEYDDFKRWFNEDNIAIFNQYKFDGICEYITIVINK